MSARSSIQALRIVALIEGLSWLVLIGAMIYRGFTGHHEPVSWAGRAHGGLFCLFGLLLLIAWMENRWSFFFSMVIGLSSLVPLGFLFADPKLHAKLKEVP
ncbi:DUF3817 domain-containing protein [Roseibacillus persicicus]|uniref:DUF3817 domain-containing protein n=1 Tax=Roseibacillus persicicus TaxID=454148 RepID=A0A918THE1_9BACT|nr:DUF3817 domain-containing protein [Roseibacillus persicicus]GHC47636.1 hypothetical protein GCM10007100_11750 [Roseibacillus persicicus]